MSSNTYFVSTTAELHDTLAVASGGDTIKLRSGTYEDVIIRDQDFGSPITIMSANPEDPAVFHDKVTILNAKNISFENVEFQLSEVPETGANSGFYALLYIVGSENVSIANSKIEGLIADETNLDGTKINNTYEGLAVGYGAHIQYSSDVSITNTEISTLYRAMSLFDTENISITKNHIHDLRNDGIVGTDQKNTLIAENLFENLRPFRVDPENPNGATDDHADFIQYWGGGADFGIDGFYVRDNIFIQEEGRMQTIFGRLNLTGTEPEGVKFSDFEVSGNLIYNSHAHAITLSSVENAKVFDNTLIPNKDILDDWRYIPNINIQYDGVSPTGSNFSLSREDVTGSRDIEVYNNIGTNAFSQGVQIKAYNKAVNTLEEVKQALNLDIYDNYWINSERGSDDPYSYVFKFDISTAGAQTTVWIDPDAEVIYDGAGSKYYYDPEALEVFFDNLGTDRSFEVDSTLLGSLTSVEQFANFERDPVQREQPQDVEAENSGSDLSGETPVSLASGHSFFDGASIRYSFGVEAENGDRTMTGWESRPTSALFSLYGLYVPSDKVVLRFDVDGRIYERIVPDLDFSITDVLVELDSELSGGRSTGQLDTRTQESSAPPVPAEEPTTPVEDEVVKTPESATEQPIPITVRLIDDETTTANVNAAKVFDGSSVQYRFGVEKVEGGREFLRWQSSSSQALFDLYGLYEAGDEIVLIFDVGGTLHERVLPDLEFSLSAVLLDLDEAFYSEDGVNFGEQRTTQAERLAGALSGFVDLNLVSDDKVTKVVPLKSLEERVNDSIHKDGWDIVILDKAIEDYDILLTDDNRLRVTEASVDYDETITSVDAIYFKASDALYLIDVTSGRTDLLDQTIYATEYDILRGAGTEISDSVPAGHALLTSGHSDDLLLGQSGDDFIKAAAGNDILVGGLGSDHLLGDDGRDTAVIGGSVIDYSIWQNLDDAGLRVRHQTSRDLDLFTSIEQIYFEGSDELYFVENNGQLSPLDRSLNASEFNRIEAAILDIAQEDILY